ncbi:hypothetical protein NLU13_7178 [Sarocladium strictum]|uniref:NADP-dependent oxidoreductase domain-containing protein n=1 Tax=Sarocladium strictum TaxID=5046 RepID=A0AA39GCB5_SARSR|nr:hypothetical protein NLU13_7178 [Sarocladium strictum]
MPLPTHFTLNTGSKIPAIGFGTWQAAPGEVEVAVETALRCGYRHLDCAAIYLNEAEVGEGIRRSGVARSDIWLTSKLWNTHHAPEDVEAAVDQTLKDLGTDYLDLYLMHWPVAFKNTGKWLPIDEDGLYALADIDPAVTWAAMEKLVQSGKVRAIGVSNFTIDRIEKLLAAPTTTITPAVNQVEAHPYLQQPELFSFCQSKGILIAAYSPLGNNQTGEPRTVDDPLVKQLGDKLGLDGGQLLVSWGVQRGTAVLPKSVTPSRIRSNFQVAELPQDVYAQLNGLERNKRFCWQSQWGFDTFQELGEAEVKRIAREGAEENKINCKI